MENKTPRYKDNPAYHDSGYDLDAIDDTAKWQDKAKNSKGGKTLHGVGDVTRVKKMCCNKMMGEKCGCEPNPTCSGHKEKH